MSENDELKDIKQKYHDLTLDLNLDDATAKEAWTNYENTCVKYTLEGDQLPWLACALYSACQRKTVPTVSSPPGHLFHGNGVSLTRMLQYCKITFIEFIKKMKHWFSMSHLEESFCHKVELLERNFAVSNNIFKKYKPIFSDIFKDPIEGLPRISRSRKQRRPPCNSTELFQFCWTLYILIKGKYPSIPQDLVSCYSLLLSSIDLLYANVVQADRKDLLNLQCKGLPSEIFATEASESFKSLPLSIMDYLCDSFEGISVDTRVVQEYYWKPIISELIENKVLKGNSDGTGLIDVINFDHNQKEIKHAYEEYLLHYGEFDERMFLNEDDVTKAPSTTNSPQQFRNSLLDSPDPKLLRRTLFQVSEGDHHLVPQTPITGQCYTDDRPPIGNTPLTVVTSSLQKLYAQIQGRKNCPSPKLQELLKACKGNSEEETCKLIAELGEVFCSLYTQTTQDYNGPSMQFAHMRLHTAQVLYYAFLEHILLDEMKREVDLDVGKIEPFSFFKIIEPVIRSEKQSNNQLSRELVKHLKSIEEQILDSLAWKSESPLWKTIKCSGTDVPSCQDVNFSDQLETNMNVCNSSEMPNLLSPNLNAMSSNPSQSPLSGMIERLNSPVLHSSARRTLFPNSDTVKTDGSSSPYLPAKETTTKTSTVVYSDQPSAIYLQSDGATVDQSNTCEKKKMKPKRHGSLALFFRKFYTLANMRLRDLCEHLDISDPELRRKIWTCFEHSIIFYTDIMKGRHMDQLIMCAIYIMCKGTKTERSFQGIMKHYRNQPQAASHIYRSVLISRCNQINAPSGSSSISEPTSKQLPTPSQVTGMSSTFEKEERGDLIKFYNNVYILHLKTFALKFKLPQENDHPPLSPLPVCRQMPLSPRRRISSNHSVFINTLSPMTCSSPMSPRKYYFNRSPAKDLHVINTMLSGKRPCESMSEDFQGSFERPLVSKRIQGVLGDRRSVSSIVVSSSNSIPKPEHVAVKMEVEGLK